MALILTVIVVALVFEYINGFHDTANSIATVVSTKVLSPRQAVILAAITNLAGALVGTAVAKTISSGLVDPEFVTTQTIIGALLGGIIWNLVTWYFGLPSSSSHALIGGLCGATFATAHSRWSVLRWMETRQKVVEHVDAAGNLVKLTVNESTGLVPKVVVPMVSSPICGFIIGFIVMGLLYFLLRNWKPRTVTRVFGKLQILSAAYMGFSHGSNDAQKTMGIITLALVAATQSGSLADLPDILSFLRTMPAAKGQPQEIALWIKLCCALVMAAGTAAGGWRIIKTLGHKMVRLQPVNGFAAETTAATVLLVAAKLGMPVSTTHAITTSIMGVGCAKRFNAVKLDTAERIIWAWILTLPVTFALGFGIVELARLLKWMP